MNARIGFLSLSLVLSAHGAAADGLSSNIVSNGDFEVVDFSFPNGFPPWQFSAGLTGYVNEPGAASGRNCVFIGGSRSSVTHMWQDIATQSGQAYQFNFYERGDEWGQSLRTSVLNVFFGDTMVGSYTRTNTVLGWNFQTFTVVADSTTTRLDFQNASWTIGSLARPGIDAVSVSAIPEPSSMPLAGTVFLLYLANCLLLRRRERPQSR